MITFQKQPSDLLDYTIDLSDWLEDEDKISEAEETMPDGLELDDKVLSDEKVKLYIKNGEDGELYKISVKITTSGGLEKEVDFQIKVKEL